MELPATWSSRKAESVLRDKRWSFFAVVREPSERLLSAYLQKCGKYGRQHETRTCPYIALWPSIFNATSPPAGGGDCCGGSGEWAYGRDAMQRFASEAKQRGPQSMFEEWVRSITSRVARNGCRENPHWSPQYCKCSLGTYYWRYTIVRYANLSEGVVDKLGNMTHLPQARREELQAFVRHRLGSNHETDGKKQNAGAQLDMYTDELRELVKKAYSRDYELFGAYF